MPVLDLILAIAVMSVVNTYISTVGERFGHLYFMYRASDRLSGVEVWENKLCMFCCSHAIQHITWYVHTLLTSKVACHDECIIHLEDEIQMSLLAHMCKCILSCAVLYAHGMMIIYVAYNS